MTTYLLFGFVFFFAVFLKADYDQNLSDDPNIRIVARVLANGSVAILFLIFLAILYYGRA